MASENKNEDIKTEMDPVIEELKRKGIKHNSKETEMVGLGDLVEETLKLPT